jgi:PPM family protein phosphatase
MLSRPEQMMDAGGGTDIGRKRKLNEDSYCIDSELGLLLIADGMGGHDAGDVASRTAVEYVRDYIRAEKSRYDEYADDLLNTAQDDDTTWIDVMNPALEIVADAVQYANKKIYACNRDRGYDDNQGMGTAIVGVWVLRRIDEAIIFHVGDSRAYLFREGKLVQLTKDHSLHQQWIDNGMIGPEPSRNVILYALGMNNNVTVDTSMQSLERLDRLLICSDGLTNLVSHEELESAISRTRPGRLDTTCQGLIDLANQRGGYDNITVILARY